MGLSTNYGGRVAFALLLWMSLAVACTAGDPSPSAGEPTLSPNAGSIMSVVPPEGGTPVPMHLFTPDPAIGQATPAASEAVTGDRAPEATEMAQRDPPVLTVGGAQALLSFPIRFAEDVPEGYELDPWVTMRKGPMPGDAPRGASVRYIPEVGEPFRRELIIEQFLGSEEGLYPDDLTPSAPEMVGPFEAQVYEIPEAGILRLLWRDPELGVNYDAFSTLGKEETLQIVSSFR